MHFTFWEHIQQGCMEYIARQFFHTSNYFAGYSRQVEFVICFRYRHGTCSNKGVYTLKSIWVYVLGKEMLSMVI